MKFIPPKNGSVIAEELGITRQAVSNILKRAMKKFYDQVTLMDTSWGPFDRSCAMMRMLNVSQNIEEIKKFYMLFPPEIRDEIEKDALENFCSEKFKDDYMNSN